MIGIGKRYELISQLGAGGMGVVYRVRDRLTRSFVALKRVQLQRLAGSTLGVNDTTSQSSATPAMRQLRTALAQEFRTLASLRHPNIISVLDYGFDDERTPYFTMELLDAPQDLITACAQLEREARIDLIVQLLRALTYLHRRGITHRDLKPSNVLIVNTPAGRVLKLVDFGIAAQRGTAKDLAGTLQYMAPEVLAGQPPTEVSDLYAVGVMLFQMLTGYFPYSRARITQQAAVTADSDESGPTMASGVVAFMYSQSSGEHTQAQTQYESHDDHVSFAMLGSMMPEPGLTELVTRLLSRDPAARYQDAAQVWSDLATVTGQPISLDTSATRESFLQASVLVGREPELEQLESALSRARNGEGSMLLLGGESGSGKSRLLDELRSSALVRGVKVLRGQAVSSGGSAYQVFLDVLRALALEITLDEQEAAVLAELLPELPELIGHSVGEAPSLNPQAAQKRLWRVLSSVLTRSSEPTLLLLEDLHWATPESIELLRELTQAAQTRPLLIVVSYRADERPELPEQFPAAEQINLQRLSAEEIAALSASMLGAAGTQPELVALLQRETEGNVRVTWFLPSSRLSWTDELTITFASGRQQRGRRAHKRSHWAGR